LPSADDLDPAVRIRTALDTLKQQHANLHKSLYSLTQIEPQQPLSTSPIEESVAEIEQNLHTKAKTSSRTSVASILSDISEWFDAASEVLVEGVQEFILDAQGAEQPSRLLSDEVKANAAEPDDTSSIDTDIEQAQTESNETVNVTRRICLPAPVVGDEGSLFTMLKKNVGKVSLVGWEGVHDISDPVLGPVNHNLPCHL
jgi:oxysterol-binding protein-related protein 3/6/7